MGKPPFETATLKDTYMRIKNIEYRVPSKISGPARSLIERMLQGDPKQRPSVEELLKDEFMESGETLIIKNRSYSNVRKKCLEYCICVVVGYSIIEGVAKT